MSLSYEEVVAKIKESTRLSDEEISSSINAKMRQFAGLVSKEGAAHIYANELGIKLLGPQQPLSSKLKISSIAAGMQNVEVLAKILAIYPAKQFSANGRAGQVGSMVLGDETGTMRAVLWNEQASKLSLVNKGDILKIKGAYIKENRNNALELHVNNRSMLVVNPPGESVEVKELRRETPIRKISEITDSDLFIEVYGTVVEVFDIRFFEDKRASTPEKPVYSYVLSVFLDDGTASVRSVFFRDSVQKLVSRSNEEILGFKDTPELFEPVKNEVLGKFLKINARVNKNEMYNRIELVANSVQEVKPEDAPQTAAAPSESKESSTIKTEEFEMSNDI